VQALIQEDKLRDAAGRIGDALAAAQLALDLDHIRRESVDASTKVALLQRGETHIQHLAEGTLPEVAVTAQHFQANRAFDLYK
jgi:siroheme synthase